MALATNSTPGSIVLAGDLTGTANTPELRVTGVTPGSYTAPDIVVDSKGRVLSASEANTTFVGDMVGTRSATALKASGVTAGSYTNASPTINSQGLVTSITSGGLTLNGMLTGAIGSNVLAPTGVVAGTYNYVGITVDQTGRVTSVNTQPTGYPISSYSVNGIVQVDQNLGLTISSGNLSGTLAASTVFGVGKTANSSNINITTGAVDVGSNIPTLSLSNTFTKTVCGTVVSITDATDLSASNVFHLPPGVTVLGTTNEETGDTFDFYSTDTSPYFSEQEEYVPSNGVHFSSVQYITDRYVAISYPTGGGWFTSTSADGITWTHGSIITGTNAIEKLGYSSSSFVVITTTGSGLTKKMTSYKSTDGINWTNTTYVFDTLPLGGYTDTRLYTAISGSIMCAVVNRVGVSGTHVYTSGNGGTTWSKTLLPQFDTTSSPYYRVVGVDWTGTYFLLQFQNYDTLATCTQHTSTNGTSWSGAGTFPSGIGATVYQGSGSRTYATSGSSWWASSDGGLTWTSKTTTGPVGSKRGFVYDGDRICLLTLDSVCNFSCTYTIRVWVSRDDAAMWNECPGSGHSYYDAYGVSSNDNVYAYMAQSATEIIYYNTTYDGTTTITTTYKQVGSNTFPVTWGAEFKFSNTTASRAPSGCCTHVDGINYCTYQG